MYNIMCNQKNKQIKHTAWETYIVSIILRKSINTIIIQKYKSCLTKGWAPPKSFLSNQLPVSLQGAHDWGRRFLFGGGGVKQAKNLIFQRHIIAALWKKKQPFCARNIVFIVVGWLLFSRLIDIESIFGEKQWSSYFLF